MAGLDTKNKCELYLRVQILHSFGLAGPVEYWALVYIYV